ncbi:hypothetical protein [Parasulfitobacter algicola]|uniref:Uncharacterized protein n=1 Tax=Parasulfitobacter algicola TaxID=2614809 RepID=A0ABX2J1B0_9RHOB|nr:hypothetical protein [Sulfitobacter algicola]NSX57043.1 hypothetical protein [Sulfitobacter algicola]
MTFHLIRSSAKRALMGAALAASLLISPLLARTIDNPDADTIGLLAAFLSGNTPNFREEALKAQAYRRANEFDKPAVLNRIEARLRAQYQGFAELDGLRLRVNASIGPYDAAAGVYRISTFKPGVYFPFRPYALLLDNAADFYEWSLPIAEARKIREISPRGAVTIEMLVLPFAVAPDDQRQVRSQIVSMKMFERRSGQLLHEVTLPESAYRQMRVGTDAAPVMIPQDQIALAGVSLGMDGEVAKALLRDAGFAIFDDLRDSFRISTAADTIDFGVQTTLLFDDTLFLNNPVDRYALHFGSQLDCRDSNQVHSCGVVKLHPEDGTVTSMALLQNAVGTSKQDVVTALFDRYGPAADRFNTYVWQTHATDQYVWGGVSTGSYDAAHDFSEISGPRHWQIEAFVMEPTPDRKTVIVQINAVNDPNAVTGSGGIKF